MPNRAATSVGHAALCPTYILHSRLKDPDDDFVLELAVKADAAIITWNVADFKHAARFGVAVMTPREFLASLEVQP